MLLNSDLIETIQETPDTVITLTTGKKVLVKESLDELLEEIVNFKIKIYNTDYNTKE
jgi:flagellar protein FlbD